MLSEKNKYLIIVIVLLSLSVAISIFVYILIKTNNIKTNQKSFDDLINLTSNDFLNIGYDKNFKFQKDDINYIRTTPFLIFNIPNKINIKFDNSFKNGQSSQLNIIIFNNDENKTIKNILYNQTNIEINPNTIFTLMFNNIILIKDNLGYDEEKLLPIDKNYYNTVKSKLTITR